MKYSLTTISLMLLSFSLTAQEETKIKNEGIEEIPKDIYFNHELASSNSEKTFPDLAYWGADRFHWAMTNADIAKIQGISDKGLNTYSEEVNKLGFKASRKYRVNRQKKTLTQVVIQFENQGNKEDNLNLFNKIQQEANKVYHAPTRFISQPQIINDQDAFLSGLVENYHLEWAGSSTRVSLILSEKGVELLYNALEDRDYQKLQKSAMEFEKYLSE